MVVSYYGSLGADTTGEGFRYGEQVSTGEKGVWKRALTPGKYALNPYAVKIELVPTVNFVLRWITGQSESHQYDDALATIEIITADGYEPLLPLSLVLHIDYQKAPSVVQRFGDVKRLITQTLDPILTAYFRDVAQSSRMLDLLTKREEIQRLATVELGRRFQEFDINCVAVLIGRPESTVKDPANDPIEKL
ncbi:MAG TPA: SPFH domain-containing protein, partial [Chthoniobacteraceae bacterium]|nr:SPFH domain-containing protein [Chthoniobacteraceae bacterium]